MASTQRFRSPQKQGRLLLASQSLQKNQVLSQRKAAALYDTPRTTLRRRLHHVPTIQEFNTQKRKLQLSEEQALIQWILELNQRGFPPHIIDVRRMADTLLAARGQNPPPQPVGQNWARRFINTQPELQMKWNRKFHSQRAKCEDPVIINAWFKRVEETRLAYGILDEDSYNFNETGFIMGVAATSKVVISSDTVGRAVLIQPGNREWVTVIEGVNAAGWAIPPFIILAGKVHQSGWYRALPTNWVVAVSDNGWTNDELGYKWIQHFNRHTESCTKGAYRLLILNGHNSHATPEFDQYCTQHKIITLCMPAHTSHLLQPLDVGCYSPLKRVYGREVQELARQGIHHIDKEDFLTTYTKVRLSIFSDQNIKSGFLATGLMPCDPQRVLSSLTVTKTPSPPGTASGAAPLWTSETPHTTAQLEQQASLVQGLLQRQSQSPTTQAVKQIIKGCQMAMHSAAILAKENSELRIANQHRKQKEQHRRRYIAQGGALQAQEA